MEANTSTRLKEIMLQRGLKQADIIRMAQPYCQKYQTKLGKSDLSQFVSGKVVPGQWKLTILGLALNVSEGWLMGHDVPMERISASSLRCPEESAFLDEYRESERFQRSDSTDLNLSCQDSLRLKKITSIYLTLNEDGKNYLMAQADFASSREEYLASPPQAKRA